MNPTCVKRLTKAGFYIMLRTKSTIIPIRVEYVLEKQLIPGKIKTIYKYSIVK